MASHAYYNETKLITVGSSSPTFDSIARLNSSRRHSTKRSSQAIAIPQTSETDAVRKRVAEWEYDRATWRMYNRIIDYRQKLSKASHIDDTPVLESRLETHQRQQSGLHESVSHRGMSSFALFSSAYQPDDCDQDLVEVFNLDL
jgi:hypothetical protein